MRHISSEKPMGWMLNKDPRRKRAGYLVPIFQNSAN